MSKNSEQWIPAVGERFLVRSSGTRANDIREAVVTRETATQFVDDRGVKFRKDTRRQVGNHYGLVALPLTDHRAQRQLRSQRVNEVLTEVARAAEQVARRSGMSSATEQLEAARVASFHIQRLLDELDPVLAGPPAEGETVVERSYLVRRVQTYQGVLPDGWDDLDRLLGFDELVCNEFTFVSERDEMIDDDQLCTAPKGAAS